MNAPSVETHPLTALPPATGWSWKKILFLTLFALATHLAFVFLLGAKKTAAPRAPTNVPVFHLADNASELIRLTDPTLFVLPHTEDFAPAGWSLPPLTTHSFGYTEPPSFLALNPENLGVAFQKFMQTNRFALAKLNFKPEPQLTLPPPAIEAVLPATSTWQLTGEIAGRKCLNPPTLTAETLNDVLAPSRVQLLVDQAGRVLSTVLLETSGYDAADQKALALARTLQFVPAEKLTFGEMIFYWHTVPISTP
jgi:hypothetical protein